MHIVCMGMHITSVHVYAHRVHGDAHRVHGMHMGPQFHSVPQADWPCSMTIYVIYKFTYAEFLGATCLGRSRWPYVHDHGRSVPQPIVPKCQHALMIWSAFTFPSVLHLLFVRAGLH